MNFLLPLHAITTEIVFKENKWNDVLKADIIYFHIIRTQHFFLFLLLLPRDNVIDWNEFSILFFLFFFSRIPHNELFMVFTEKFFYKNQNFLRFFCVFSKNILCVNGTYISPSVYGKVSFWCMLCVCTLCYINTSILLLLRCCIYIFVCYCISLNEKLKQEKKLKRLLPNVKRKRRSHV